MTEIKWQEPPRRGSRTDWDSVATALKDNPGRWALVAERTNAMRAHYIKQGRLVAFRPVGHFEARSSRRPDGKHDIYARYVGEASA